MASRDEMDRRKQRRFDVQKPMFVVLRPEFEVVGKLTDISAGGMAFEYNAFGSCQKVEETLVDVFSHPSEVVLMKASCRVVYDHQIDGPLDSPDCQSRRCGVEFRALTGRQQNQLKRALDMQSSSILGETGSESVESS